MDEEKIELEVRFAALEYLVATLINRVRAIAPFENPILDEMENAGIQQVGLQAIGIGDPAMSDHISGELQDAMRRILDYAREMREAAGIQRPVG